MSLEYRRPSWIEKKMDLASITDEQIEEMKREAEEVRKYNSEIARIKCEKFDQARKLLKELFPRETALHRYVNRYRVSSYYEPWDFVASIKKAREEKEKAEKAKKAEAELQALQAKAILWLQERGKKLGEDFRVADAIETANAIAFEEEVARKRAEGGLFSFSGEDSCEDCGGWDGESRRCECGNRRVSWESGWGHSFLNPYVHGEAY